MKWTMLTLFCLFTLFSRAALAQETVPIPPIPHVDVSGPYLWAIGGHEIIKIKTSAGGYNPYMRCGVFDARTVEILNRTQAPPLRPSDIRVVSRGGRDMIVVRRFLLLDVRPEDARVEGTTTGALAQKWARSVRVAFPDIAPRPGKFGV